MITVIELSDEIFPQRVEQTLNVKSQSSLIDFQLGNSKKFHILISNLIHLVMQTGSTRNNKNTKNIKVEKSLKGFQIKISFQIEDTLNTLLFSHKQNKKEFPLLPFFTCCSFTISLI